MVCRLLSNGNMQQEEIKAKDTNIAEVITLMRWHGIGNSNGALHPVGQRSKRAWNL